MCACVCVCMRTCVRANVGGNYFDSDVLNHLNYDCLDVEDSVGCCCCFCR